MTNENTNLITPAPVTTPVDPAAVAAAPVVAHAPVPEPAPAAIVAAPSTVLGEALFKEPIKEEIKPVETPKVVEPAKVEAQTEKKLEGQSEVAKATPEEPTPPPVYDQFKVPEGVTLDTEQVKKFTDILSNLETTNKVEHKAIQEFGQKAVDFHIDELQKALKAQTELYTQTWDRQKVQWKDAFLKDPEIGGNRFQTTVDSALTFIRTHGGTAEQQAEFRTLMETSGLGNHPAMIRLLANAGRAMAEGKPLAAQKPVPQTKSKVATLYGEMAS